MNTPSALRPSILCVEDNAEFLQLLEMGLTAHGFEVVAAASLEDGLKRFRAHPDDFSCVLTDHDMPGGNGAELSRQLRAAGYHGTIIVMSGRLTEKDLGAYQGLAISGFFRKPFQLQTLLSMLAATSSGYPVGEAAGSPRAR